MAFLLEPLLQKNHHKHGGHDKVQTLRVKMNQGAENAAHGGAADPVQLVEQGDKEHEETFVHPLRHLCGAVDGKALVAHSENQVDFFKPGAPVLVQHGNSIEQMPGVQHQGHGQRLYGIEGSKKQIDGHEFHGTGEDRHAHEHGIPEGKAGHIHVNAVGHPQKGKPGKNGDGIGKGRLQGGQVLIVLGHALILRGKMYFQTV